MRRYRTARFAIEKDKLWLQGEDGKEYQTRLVKQMSRTVNQASAN
jgi:hypothetical protein